MAGLTVRFDFGTFSCLLLLVAKEVSRREAKRPHQDAFVLKDGDRIALRVRRLLLSRKK
jgi:hypothetical protein